MIYYTCPMHLSSLQPKTADCYLAGWLCCFFPIIPSGKNIRRKKKKKRDKRLPQKVWITYKVTINPNWSKPTLLTFLLVSKSGYIFMIIRMRLYASWLNMIQHFKSPVYWVIMTRNKVPLMTCHTLNSLLSDTTYQFSKATSDQKESVIEMFWKNNLQK